MTGAFVHAGVWHLLLNMFCLFQVGAVVERLLGPAMFLVCYLAMAVADPLLLDGVQPVVLSTTHLGALGLLWHWRRQADLYDHDAYTRFYLRVWKLFFLEYVALPLACVA